MTRKYFDNSEYLSARKTLLEQDGIHCIYCGKPLPKYKRTRCSDECFENFYNKHRPNNWSILRAELLKQYPACQECGARGDMYALEVHHIKPICEGGDEFDPKNLIVLCTCCHTSKHTKIGRIQRENMSLERFT